MMLGPSCADVKPGKLQVCLFKLLHDTCHCFLFHFDIGKLFLSYQYLMFGPEFTFLQENEKCVLIKSLLTYSKECNKSCFVHLTVLIEMTDMWYTGMAFFEVCF